MHKRSSQINPEILAVAESLRVNDAAKMIGVSRSSIYKLINNGSLTNRLIAGRRLILREDLCALLRGERR